MKDKEEIINHIIAEISKYSEKIRSIEDMCNKFLIDPVDERAYTSVVAYRMALADLLDEIRGKKNEKLFRENKSFKTRGRS